MTTWTVSKNVMCKAFDAARHFYNKSTMVAFEEVINEQYKIRYDLFYMMSIIKKIYLQFY